MNITDEMVEKATMKLGRRRHGHGDADAVFRSWFQPSRQEYKECAEDARAALEAALGVVGNAEAILKDPAAMHLNMLRGGIAKLTPAQIGHLYRGNEAREVISEVQRQNPGAVGDSDSHLLKVRTRQLSQAHEMWCKAAEKAIGGMSGMSNSSHSAHSLWLRVQMHRSEPVGVVLSAPPNDGGKG